MVLRVLLACLLILIAPLAQAKFTTPKYNFTLKLMPDDELRSDLNWINYRMQNDFGPRMSKEYSDKLAIQKPLMHPVDVGMMTDQRKEAYFKKSSEDLAKITKPLRDREIIFIIDQFEDAELERIKNFFEAYPKFANTLMNYDHYRTLTYEVHAVYTPDHRKRWDIAADIAVMLLQIKPLYIDFTDEKVENKFTNNVVNYLTNNFDIKQLQSIKEFMGSVMGQKYVGLLYRLYNGRYNALLEIFKKNYPVFAEPEQEKKSDKEFH